MWIFYDNVTERRNDDEDFEKNSLFFLTIHHSEIDLFETKV